MSSAEQKLKQVLASVFDVELSAITENASNDTVERWDSLRHMNLIIALEEEFGIEFTGEQAGDLISYKLIKIVLQEQGVNFA